MTSPLRRLLILIGVAFLAVLGLILLLGGPRSEVTLADGTRLRLLGVSAGPNRFSTERPWHRTVKKHLPPQYLRWLPKTINASCGRTNTMAIWLQHYDPMARTNLNRRWGRLEAVSDHGDVFKHSGGAGSCSSPGRYQAFILPSFPRRQRSFLVRLYDQENRLAAELRVPNPGRGPFPDWKPEPLPVAKTNGDLSVTCMGWKRLLEELSPGRTNEHLKADFEFKWAGAPTTEWELGTCELSDATGNAFGGLYPELALSEPAWRLRARFQRHRTATFGSGERFALTNLTVPAPGSFIPLNVSTSLQGVALRMLWWSGPATLTLSNGLPVQAEPPHRGEDYRQLSLNWEKGIWRETISLGRPTLILAHTPHGLETQLSWLIRDSAGREVPVRREWAGPTMPDPLPGQRLERLVLQPELAEGVSKVSLEIIVQRLRTMDFYLEPPRAVQWVGNRRPP